MKAPAWMLEVVERARSTAPWTLDDGGRAAAGLKGDVGDCVTRAITIATGRPYLDVYAALHAEVKGSRLRKHRRKSPRDGVRNVVFRRYLERNGWRWIPTMGIGSGCTVHLVAEELRAHAEARGLRADRMIVAVSKHLVAVIDGMIRDTHDPSRGGTRCVYGYFVARLT